MFRVIWQCCASHEQSDHLLESNLFSDFSIISEPGYVIRKSRNLTRPQRLELSEKFRDNPDDDFFNYQHTYVNDLNEASLLRDRLLTSSSIRHVDIQGSIGVPNIDNLDEPISRPSPPGRENLRPLQKYLNPSPTGIDAEFVWTIPGGRGKGVTIVDIEAGWDLDHKDLVRNLDQNILFSGVSSASSNEIAHGTRVLGVIGADNNSIGVTGIASDAMLKVASPKFGGNRWNLEEALDAVIDKLSPGDVILIELQNETRERDKFFPVEGIKSSFSMIRKATRKGIYVVEVAGNGRPFQEKGVDLDKFELDGRSPFSRDSGTFLGDSGAVLVGAGYSGLSGREARSKVKSSNFGSRVDLQGWGSDVATTTSANRYVTDFGETSSASAMVAGAIASISGIIKAAGRSPMPPKEMRQLLIDTGIRQAGDLTKKIGPLPNLKEAVKALEL